MTMPLRTHLLPLLGLITCTAAPAGTRRAPVRPGVEVLLSDSVHLITGKRLALLTNHTGVDRAGRRDVDVLLAAHARLTVLFSPEHGFRGLEDRPGLPDAVDSATGLPIYSLYNDSRSYRALDSVDVLLIDLQDIGARYYTYPPTAVLLLREAARRGKPVIALDRPDPVGGDAVQGNVRAVPEPLDSGGLDFLPLPMRHGLTLGELLRLANDVYGIHADLTVVPAQGWVRSAYYDATGLPWVKPSPNMPDLESATHYPGTCLFEATNLSVGRGTAFAFQVIGAPWIDAAAVIGKLREAGSGMRDGMAGVEVTAVEFTPRGPTDGKYDGVALHGVRLRVTDRQTYDPTKLAVVLLTTLRALYPDSLTIRAGRFDQLAAGPALRAAIVSGREPQMIWSDWDSGLSRFRQTRAKYLLY
jgi:uncharacterized protein YbbC (DUF1343 family)